MPALPQPSVELLAPAGDWDCVRAAIENGADAIYFGLDCGHNARARATNFAVDDLPKLLRTMHARGVKGFVTLNTLIFSDELAGVEELVRRLAGDGADAVLVQDLGLVRLIRDISPDLPIHASTQMTMTSAENIRVIESLGIDRVVLARELSLDEIAKIHALTTMPLEAFVHGALCVAYSGQCLTSESLGGRSANRGQCAQACRLPYEVVCDGRDVELEKVKYLLSPQDLAAYALVPDLIQAGVMSLKIEGRLKTPEYVANITKHYRQAIDEALAGRQVQFSQQDVREMELSFSRGFSPGWLQGCDHKMLVPGISSAKRGVLLGTIQRVQKDRVHVRLAAPLRPGDGLVFDGDRAAGEEQGGRVYEIFRGGVRLEEAAPESVVELAFAHGAIDFSQLVPHQQVWKTDDPELTRRLRRTFTSEKPQRRVPLDLHVIAIAGEPLQIRGVAASGAECHVQASEPLVVATKHPLDEATLRKQLGRLGGTVFELRNLTAEISGEPMSPLSVLGALRHEMIAQLAAAADLPPARRIANEPILPKLRAAGDAATVNAAEEAPRLHVLCRTLAQVEALAAAGVPSLLADFEDIRGYRQAVAIAQQHRAELYLATPRIQKPDELGVFRALEKQQPSGFLARNLAGLRYFIERSFPTIADFSLNAANELTVKYLRELGATRVTASYDLNREQLLDLVAAAPAVCLEVVVHQHMPMFHMEHCVFCAVLSPGTNKTNCGRPCDDHRVELRDRLGMLHPLKADVGCRNTLYNAVPQSAAEAVPLLMTRGVRNFRVELLDASPDEALRVVRLYEELLSGRIAAKEVWQTLQAANRVGVTRGTLEERRNPLAIL